MLSMCIFGQFVFFPDLWHTKSETVAAVQCFQRSCTLPLLPPLRSLQYFCLSLFNVVFWFLFFLDGLHIVFCNFTHAGVNLANWRAMYFFQFCQGKDLLFETLRSSVPLHCLEESVTSFCQVTSTPLIVYALWQVTCWWVRQVTAPWS